VSVYPPISAVCAKASIIEFYAFAQVRLKRAVPCGEEGLLLIIPGLQAANKMSSDMNITAAIGMSSGDPGQRQVLQQTWSSVSHLVNVSGEPANFPALLAFSQTLSSVKAQSNLGGRVAATHP